MVGLTAIPAFARADCLSRINNMTAFSNIPMTLTVSNPIGNNAGFVTYVRDGSVIMLNSTTAQSHLNLSQVFSDRFNGSQPFNINAAELVSFTITSGGALNVHNATNNFNWSANLTCVAGSNAIAVGFTNGMEVMLTLGARNG